MTPASVAPPQFSSPAADRPLRILYHHRTLADGAEGIHIYEMVAAFRRLGHEVRFAGIEPGRPRSSDGGGRHHVLSTIRARLPNVLYEPAQVAATIGSYFAFRQSIARFKPDFVYKRHAKFDFGPVLAANHAEVPIILEVNCVYSSRSLRPYEPVTFERTLRAAEGVALSRANLVISVSQALKDDVEALSRTARVSVMPNGVDQRRFTPDGAAGQRVRQQLGLDGRTIIGFVGTLWRWHGLDMLVSAFRLLRNTRNDVHLLVVGDGEVRNELQRQALEGGLGDSITFVGRVPHQQIPAYLNAFDIAVLPAEHRAHASPMKLIEYMAAARAIAAPRLPNIAEILSDGVEGLLFPANDISGMAATLERLICEPELAHALGQRARHKVDTTLSWDANASRVIEMYCELCARPKRR